MGHDSVLVAKFVKAFELKPLDLKVLNQFNDAVQNHFFVRLIYIYFH